MVLDSYKELIARRQALDTQIEAAHAAEKAAARQVVRQLVADHALAPEDIFAVPPRKREPRHVAAKYRHPSTGATWTGRGRPPAWIIRVVDRTPFLINHRDGDD